MEYEYKPVVQPQGHHNPNTLEVVKKEVLKLMNAGMIYPISDSLWVSHPERPFSSTVYDKILERLEDSHRTGGSREDNFDMSLWHLCVPPHAVWDMIEMAMEVFMDDFSVCGNSFGHCLANIKRMLKSCVETKLMLNWKNCHFMVTEGIVLDHKISTEGIEVDLVNIDTISRLPPPTSVKAIRSFLGHAGFL
ncbi:uncharacterized protein LOC143635711 [Bidens hawaiensis]|uniref:uncharacterized protein LOC143635711 n=1 Tax=Bidens hawaiensis TaxID=980011 RepID=UPI00404AAA75